MLIQHHQYHCNLDAEPSDHRPILITLPDQKVLSFNALSQPFIINQIRDFTPFRTLYQKLKKHQTVQSLQAILLKFTKNDTQSIQDCLSLLALEDRPEHREDLKLCVTQCNNLKQAMSPQHNMHWYHRTQAIPWETLLKHQPEVISLQEISHPSIVSDHIIPLLNESQHCISYDCKLDLGHNYQVLLLNKQAFELIDQPIIMPLHTDNHHVIMGHWVYTTNKQLALICNVHHPRHDKVKQPILYEQINKIIYQSQHQPWFKYPCSVQCYGDFNASARYFDVLYPINSHPALKHSTHFRGLHTTSWPRLNQDNDIDGGLWMDFGHTAPHQCDITTFHW